MEKSGILPQRGDRNLVNDTPSPPVFLYECDYREVEVVCFDILLQVLILKNLYCTKIVQNAVPFVSVVI